MGAQTSMQSEVNQMVWSSQGDALWVAMNGAPGKIQVFPAPSLANDNSVSLSAHQCDSISLAADQQGKYVASGGGDCLVALWDPRHLTCVRTFGYAAQLVTTLGFNKTGTVLAWGTGTSSSTGGEKNLTFVGADTGTLYWQEITVAPVVQLRWHATKNVVAYAMNVNQIPHDRDTRPHSTPACAVLRTLKVPEAALS